MKRFLCDALLVLVIVSNMHYDFDQEVSVEEQVRDFEAEVSREQIVKPKTETVRLQDIKENKASASARGVSEFIVGVTEEGAHLFGSLFGGILQ